MNSEVLSPPVTPPATDKRAQLAALLRRKAAGTVVDAPVSHGQRALWFLHQSAPDSPAYHVAFSVRLRDAVHVPALQRAFQALVDRHSSLRSTFTRRDGELVQQIHGHQDVAFRHTPLAGATEAELRAAVDSAYREPFSLERGPLCRVDLFSRAGDDHVLLFTVHHIVYDGWSLWQNLDEAGRLYAAEAGGDKLALPPLPVSYQDYVREQEALLQSPEGERLWQFWQNALAGELPTLNLPTDFTRPPVQRLRGASHRFELSAPLARSLKDLAQANGVTPFTLLLTAFQVLLQRYTGQDDVLVGAPTARRDARYAEVVGYFVNPVVLRSDLSGNPSFQALLAEVHATVLRSLEHQDFPFPLLVERLRPNRDPSFSPLFQVSFVFQRSQRQGGLLDLTMPGGSDAAIRWGGLAVERYELAQQEGQFDLELELINVDDALYGAFKYNADLFEPATLARLEASFQVLLAGIVADPAAPIGQLPILSPAGRAEVLALSGAADGTHLPVECLHATFEAHAARTPDAVALVCDDTALSYRELDHRAEVLAKYLQANGVGPDTLVGLCLDRSLDLIIGLLGILKAGGAYVPLDPATPVERRAFIIEDSAAPILLTQATLAPDLQKAGAKVISLDADWPLIEAVGGDKWRVLERRVGVDHLAYVIYTSGTTGRPKGVQITHRNVSRIFTATRDWYHFGPDDVWPLFHSFAFDVSVWEIWGALLHGGRLIVVPYLVSRSPADFRDLVRRHRVTVLNQTPSAFRLYLQAELEVPQDPDPALRAIIFAGEALDIQSLRPWFERYGDQRPTLVNMYGITETTIHASYRPIRRADLQSPRSVVGVPIPDLQIYLLDPWLQPVPIGVIGEIHVGGDGLGRGYLRRPELDAARYLPHPFSQEAGARVYKSGDLARYLPNGDIEYLGRLDNQVKIRGFRIELGEIETVLGAHPDVAWAVVRVQGEQRGGKRLVAHIVPATPGAQLAATLRSHLLSKLPEYMVPSVFVMIDRLPLTGNGKLDYRALPQPEFSRNEQEATLAPPRDAIEQTLVRLWETILEVRPIGVRDNFFTLGGHSMLAVYLMAEIEREFGQALPLATLFQHPTIEALGAALRSAAGTPAWSPLVPIRPEGEATPLFCVAGGGGNVLYFYPLAHQLPPGRPFYGLQAIGLDGQRAPLTRIEDIAAEYLREIRTCQPHGPYLLGGHCLGGWIAFEMAQQLLRAGEPVEAVYVIDAPAPRRDAPLRDLAQVDDAEWLAKFGAVLSESAGKEFGIDLAALRCLDPETQLRHFQARLEAGGMLPPDTPLAQVRGLFQVFVANSKADYRPADVRPVQVVLLRAGEAHPDYDYAAADEPGASLATSTLGWQALASLPVPVAVVPGNHITMMSEPHVHTLAQQLGAFLSAVPAAAAS